MLVPETEILSLWEAIYWAIDRLRSQYIVVEGDVQNILTLFKRHDNYTYLLLLRDIYMLGNYFGNISVQHS